MAITAEIRNLVQRATEEHEASEQQPEQALVDEVEQEQDPAPLDAPCLESNSPSAPASRSRQSMDMSRKRESLVLDSALISKMLPRKVCLHVRQGKPVPPEFFSNVSIFFSDVVGFTNISAAVEPIQVIRLLVRKTHPHRTHFLHHNCLIILLFLPPHARSEHPLHSNGLCYVVVPTL